MIKCAAIKHQFTGIVFSMAQPARHHHILQSFYWLYDRPLQDFDTVQGFLTEAGDFIDREAAFKLTGKGRHGKTYSEDLW